MIVFSKFLKQWSENPNDDIVKLFLTILKFIPENKTDIRYTNERLYFKDERHKKLFLKTCAIVEAYFYKNLNWSDEEEVIETINGYFPKAGSNLVLQVLGTLDSISTLIHGERRVYRIKFENLKKTQDRVYRILSDNKSPMHHEDIKLSIAKNLGLSPAAEEFEKLALNKDARIVPISKSGKWALKEWDVNSESIVTLIIKCIKEYGEAITADNLVSLIRTKRTNAKRNSVKAIAGSVCLQLADSRYILPKWESKYKHIGLKRRKSRPYRELDKTKRLRDKIYEIIKESEQEYILMTQIINRIRKEDQKIGKTTIYKLMDDKDKFKYQISIAGKKMIGLISN